MLDSSYPFPYLLTQDIRLAGVLGNLIDAVHDLRPLVRPGPGAGLCPDCSGLTAPGFLPHTPPPHGRQDPRPPGRVEQEEVQRQQPIRRGILLTPPPGRADPEEGQRQLSLRAAGPCADGMPPRSPGVAGQPWEKGAPVHRGARRKPGGGGPCRARGRPRRRKAAQEGRGRRSRGRRRPRGPSRTARAAALFFCAPRTPRGARPRPRRPPRPPRCRARCRTCP